MAYYYDPIEMLAEVLKQEYEANRISYDDTIKHLTRSEGSCHFCVNDLWQFPEGCNYGKTSIAPPPIGGLENVVKQITSQNYQRINNQKLFNAISKRDDVELIISLDHKFSNTLNQFRKATSEIRTLNGIDYPSVYLDKNDYGGLTIKFDGKELRLIVNLQYYYVYGFFFDDNNVYAFNGEAVEALQQFGFRCKTIPYGDAYYNISEGLSDSDYYKLKQTNVELPQLKDALAKIADLTIPFSDKNEAILIVFWSLIEGIRFSSISHVIADLIKGKRSDYIYDYFYELAEIWAKLCLIAAYKKTLNLDIDVYDIKRIH